MAPPRNIISCLFLTLTVLNVEAARILGIFPIPAKSHFTCNEAIMRSLVAAGHNVTLVTSFPEQAAGKNFTVIDVSQDTFIYVGRTTWRYFAEVSTYRLIQLAGEIEMPYCEKVLKLEHFQSILNSNEKLYDVIFIESFIVSKCFQYLAEKMQIPIIGTVTFRSWMLADRAISNPFYPSYTPVEQLQIWDYSGFLGRLVNLWNMLQIEFYWYTQALPFLHRFHDQNQNALGNTSYLDRTPSLMFYNSFPEYLSRPMNPNAIQIGGIHVEKAKPLSPAQGVKKFVDEAVHGVIVFSLGSVVRADSLEAERVAAFKEAFSQIPQRVIWKFEAKIENLPPNVLLLEWIPQRDLLAHKNVVAIIMHGGQGGIYEAIYSGKPIVSMPIFADQKSNTIFLESLKVAARLDVYSVSKEAILTALRTVLSEEYRENMETLSQLLRNRQMSPQETVVYWTEYVIRNNGAPHLQNAVAGTLNWFQFFLLDIIGVVFLLAVIFVYVMHRVVKGAYLRCCKQVLSVEDKNKKAK